MTEQEIVDEIVRRVSINRIEISTTRSAWDWFVAGFNIAGGVAAFIVAGFCMARLIEALT